MDQDIIDKVEIAEIFGSLCSMTRYVGSVGT